MYTAKRARAETEAVNRQRVEFGIIKLEAKIKEAVKQGKFSVTIDGTVAEQTREHLKGMGYSIQTGTQYNESYTCIKWS